LQYCFNNFFLTFFLFCSTLLDLLADRKVDGNWSGEVYINSKPRSNTFKKESAYVMQDDVHIATLTVEETVYFSAYTRLVEGTSQDDILARTNLLLDMLGLTHVKNSLVGDGMKRGISGGQLKRLPIAVELVSLPSLIFLDEPTSGLDSSIALEVMTAVYNLSLQKRTCISTIHQPSPEVFALFNKVALLSKGRLIYLGPVDDVIAYFSCPELNYKFNHNNPAEFIVEICGVQLLPQTILEARQPKTSKFFSKKVFIIKTLLMIMF
jgi:ABC-type multidrug transport system ATPase subunit